MKKIIGVAVLFGVAFAGTLLARSQDKISVLSIDSCKKDVCMITFMGKSYEAQIKNKTKSSLNFGSESDLSGTKIEYKQKYHTTMTVSSAEYGTLNLERGRIFVNFKTTVKQDALEQQKRYLVETVVGKLVTVYYNNLKDGVIATGDVVILFGGKNLVTLLNEKKEYFESYGKKYVEKVLYVSKKTEEKFKTISLDAGKLQADFTIIGTKSAKCSAKLYTSSGKLVLNLFEIIGPTKSGTKLHNAIGAGDYYVVLIAPSGTCSLSLKQLLK